jgi:hypothetical protein
LPKLLTALLALLFAAPASANLVTLFSNGLVPNFSGYSVDQGTGDHVTDAFTIHSTVTILEIDFMLVGRRMEWAPPTVDWAITGSPFGGTVYGSGTADLGSPDIFASLYDGVAYNFELYLETFNPDVILGPGDYWLELSNTSNLFTPSFGVDWVASGGSTSAFSSSLGPIASESFEILGTPEPASMTLLGGGLLLGALLLRRQRTREASAPASTD